MFEIKTMVDLRRPNKPTRGSGLNMRFISLFIVATLLLVFWAYMRLFHEGSALWILILAILTAVLGFGLAFQNIFSAWRKNRKQE